MDAKEQKIHSITPYLLAIFQHIISEIGSFVIISTISGSVTTEFSRRGRFMFYSWPVTVSSRHYVVSYILDEAFRFRLSANYTLPFLFIFVGLSVFDSFDF